MAAVAVAVYAMISNAAQRRGRSNLSTPSSANRTFAGTFSGTFQAGG